MKLWRNHLTVLALTATTLAGCAASGQLSPAPQGIEKVIKLPDPPADLKACFTKTVGMPFPTGQVVTRKQILALVAQLKASEQAKSACGLRFLAWYDREKKGLGL